MLLGYLPALGQTAPPAKNTRIQLLIETNDTPNEATAPQVVDTMETNMKNLVTEMRLSGTEVKKVADISTRIEQKVVRLN